MYRLVNLLAAKLQVRIGLFFLLNLGSNLHTKLRNYVLG